MRPVKKYIGSFLIVLPLFLFLAVCKHIIDKGHKNINDPFFEIVSDKGFYKPGESVRLTYNFYNAGDNLIAANYLTVEIRNISAPSAPVVIQRSLIEEMRLQPGSKLQETIEEAWQIPGDAAEAAYGIYITYEEEESSKQTKYLGFFRVASDAALTTYRIDHHQYKGIDVFALHGGMSAECVVAKAAENLKPGIAHSWYVNAPGSGPEHVLATPQFLERSVKETVEFYNKTLGKDTYFETVIIGPGLESIPYLSYALKAPFLPIHFLASANTVKEIQSVLDYSNTNGYSSYATLGHDYSVPFAVAWVKLLELPDEYLHFLQQHRVKNIIIAGYTGSDGEVTAKKVANGAMHSLYEPGSLFILHPGGGSNEDMEQLKQKIVDFSTTAQQPNFIRIADWESGILTEQSRRYVEQATKQMGIINARLITSKDMIHLWDLATYVSAAFLHKNEVAFSHINGSAVKGLSLNPYFATNAFFETWAGFIPLIYWQLNTEEHTASRAKQVTAAALDAYFPGTAFTTLDCWINSSNNFGGAGKAAALKQKLAPIGFARFIDNKYSVDDIWNEADGMNAPVETRAVQIANAGKSSPELKAWYDQLKALTIDDIDTLQKKFPVIIVSTIQ
jgi:hypothetical protein